MPVFDWLTMTGSLNSETQNWVRRPSVLRTSALTSTTMDTIAIASSTGVLFEYLLLGRQTGNTVLYGERGQFGVYNNAGTLALFSTFAPNTTQTGHASSATIGTTWTNAVGAATPFLDAVISGTNMLLKVIPQSTAQTDWQLLADLMVV